MKTREQATDRHGLPLAPGLLVRWLDGAGHLQAQIVRIIGDYDLVTVVVEDRTGRAERMIPCAELELLSPAREAVRVASEPAVR